ncbi:MAG: hypothetical protein AB8B77_03430, partial [Alphaproteobacteria bacterium]
MTSNSTFEITGGHIAQLNDADLRDLIGLLCEAECVRTGISPAGVRYGGHQDAPDGGIDVMVEVTEIQPNDGFIPRNISGFQVKKPKMSPSSIISEMMQAGQLRPKIKQLIAQKGAYIIISSGGITDSAYGNRIGAMKTAIAGEAGHEDLKIDFYDQTRIATWVRTHPAVILWVRGKIGQPLQGWKPYGNWSYGTDEEYILDEEARLIKPDNQIVAIDKGLSCLREILNKAGSSVRLVGLSGVGKTRLVQALFDEKIGENTLSPSLACYADISDDPIPTPETLINQLASAHQRAIIIIDNCTPELHRGLASTCKGSDHISLLTVEYDVRDDLPEETEVFKLETASARVIEQIISKRYTHIHQKDAYRIADFSDGNARVAIALANTVKKGESLSNFQDTVLFERLFWQRNQQDNDLLKAAEILSLVYSFNGEDIEQDSQLDLLGKLIDKSAGDLFRDVGTLKERGLIQSRGKWRALLPQAIANKLAKDALKKTHQATIHQDIINSVNVNSVNVNSGNVNSGKEHLIKSFSRRLSYLHDSEAAVEIAAKWLAPDGLIGK